MSKPTICPYCGQGYVHEMRVIGTCEDIQVCDECDSTWPAGAVLDASRAEDLSAFLDGRGVSQQRRALQELNPAPVKTQDQKVRDIRAKKPRRELKERIRENGGDASALSWLDAMEYDTILAKGGSDTAGGWTVFSLHSSSDAKSWQAVLPFEDVESILDVGAHSVSDDVFVYFGILDEYGAARCRRSQVGPNLIPFALAASNTVSVGSPDLSSWLTVETEGSPLGALLTARGDYWPPPAMRA